MMPTFTITEARAYHCGQMTRLLRAEHASAIARLGVDSHRELRQRYDASAYRKAWLIDGKLAGLGGVTGSKLSSRGYIWLALSNEAMKYPLAVVREAKRQMDAIMAVKREVLTTILDGDKHSRDFAIFLGFVVIDGEWLEAMTTRSGRRWLAQRFDKTPEARVPIGTGFGVAMRFANDEVGRIIAREEARRPEEEAV